MRSYSIKKVLSLLIILAMVLSFTACGGSGNSEGGFPEKEITIVTWSSVGGGGDICSRKWVEIVKNNPDLLGQDLVVENIPGAACIAACEHVKAADPDGYTLLFTTATFSSIPWGTDRPDLAYEEGYKAVISFSREPMLFVIRADETRFTDFESFIEYAKAHPGELSVAGGGTGEQVITTDLEKQSGADYELVMYDGGSEMAAALAGGHIDATFAGPTDVISYEEAGKLKTIAIFSDERYEAYPDVPVVSEFGYDILDADQWRGLVVPKDTPDEIVSQLYDIFYNIMQTDEWQEFLELNLMEESYKSTEEFDAFLKEQNEAYKEWFANSGE